MDRDGVEDLWQDQTVDDVPADLDIFDSGTVG